MRMKSLLMLGLALTSALVAERSALARPAPPGSYQETCTDIRYAHGTLTATCRTVDQRPRRSSLNEIGLCNGDIANNDGRLQCNRGKLPPGSYLQSCSHAEVRGRTLVASCRTVRGDWRTSSLPELHDCVGDISNQDGTLTCPR
jgi:hypothetical protein